MKKKRNSENCSAMGREFMGGGVCFIVDCSSN